MVFEVNFFSYFQSISSIKKLVQHRNAQKKQCYTMLFFMQAAFVLFFSESWQCEKDEAGKAETPHLGVVMQLVQRWPEAPLSAEHFGLGVEVIVWRRVQSLISR